jgi:hypothetical protein
MPLKIAAFPKCFLDEIAARRSTSVFDWIELARSLDTHGLEIYKDSFWTYPEFAQKMEVFLELVDAIPDHDHFGVQYDPSNAIVAGDDQIDVLRAAADRLVSMHARACCRTFPGPHLGLSGRRLTQGPAAPSSRRSDGLN